MRDIHDIAWELIGLECKLPVTVVVLPTGAAAEGVRSNMERLLRQMEIPYRREDNAITFTDEDVTYYITDKSRVAGDLTSETVIDYTQER